MKSDNALFFTCSLIEYIGRVTRNSRRDIVSKLQPDIKRIYSHADVFHCEPIEKVANDFITRDNISKGEYDPVSKAKYNVPDYWDIGEVFARLIEDTSGEDVVSGITKIFSSWIAEKILNFNSDLYYQPREYLAACYNEGKILVA